MVHLPRTELMRPENELLVRMSVLAAMLVALPMIEVVTRRCVLSSFAQVPICSVLTLTIGEKSAAVKKSLLLALMIVVEILGACATPTPQVVEKVVEKPVVQTQVVTEKSRPRS